MPFAHASGRALAHPSTSTLETDLSQVTEAADRAQGSAFNPWLVGAQLGSHSRLADLLALMQGDARGRFEAAQVPVATRKLHAGDMLFHEGAPAEAVYFVLAGMFKTFRTAEDGYEQVLDFTGRAELLGFDAYCSGEHPTGAVALAEARVYVVATCGLACLGERMPSFRVVMDRAVSQALARRSEHADLMAAVAAEVRLARFVLQLSRRMAAQRQSARRFRLTMTRREIASYLGVAHETVSRSFAVLSALGLLKVDNREICVLDDEGLKTYASRTRRFTDDEVGGSPQHTARRRPDPGVPAWAASH